MFSNETESRITKLFVNLFEGEKSVEIARNVLCDQIQFDAYHIFNSLDKEEKNYVDEYNIVDFLKTNSIYATLSEARIIISFYDSDFDGNLNYSEILNLLISDSNFSIRRISRERISFKKMYPLSYDVNYSLMRLLERELDLARAVELLVTDIKNRYDYNILDVYTTLQGYGSYISSESIRKFMIKNGIDVIESEVNNLFKRLDVDRDNRVTFNEFKKLFNSSLSSSSKFDSLQNTSSSLYEQRSKKITSYESPKKTGTIRSPLRSSVFRVHSPLRERTIDVLNKSVERIDFNRSLAKSPLRSTGFDSKYGLSNGFSEEKSSLRNNYVSYEEETFISFLREILEIENDIEKAKIDLTYKSDFNVEDSFRNFELDGRGHVTDLDLNYGLNAFDIFVPREEVTLLIKRYDINNEGVLSFSNFFDMVAPVDRDFRRRLENRLPSICNPRHNKSDNLLPSTRLALSDLFRLLIRSEVRIEAYRQKMNRLTRFSVKNIFQKIDKLEKNYLLDSDLISYMNRNAILFVDRDVDFIFIRIDKDRDGRISYSEFYDEIYPKSKEYFG